MTCKFCAELNEFILPQGAEARTYSWSRKDIQGLRLGLHEETDALNAVFLAISVETFTCYLSMK